MKTSIGNDIEKAAYYLRKGDVVAIPTETVYGLSANALNTDSVKKIFIAKNRPLFNPLILHIAGLDQVERYTQSVPSELLSVAESCWPGPLTLLVNKSDQVPDMVTAGSSKVAIRVPNHPLTQSLLEQLDFPLAAPSANPFGYISPTAAQHVYNQLQGKLPYILDGGSSAVGLESTIIGFENNTLLVYRLGGITLETLSSFGYKVKLVTKSEDSPQTSGQLKNHYAPRKPLFFVCKGEEIPLDLVSDRTAVISTGSYVQGIPDENHIIFPSNDAYEYAANHLFTTLHELDNADYDYIIALSFEEEFLGSAINDRLKKASYNC